MHEGEPLVRRAARAAIDAGASPVIVVLGADADMVRPALSSLGDVKIVVNTEWKTGVASSLAAGLREVGEDHSCEGALVMLTDQPFVDAAALRRLLAAFDDEHALVASEYDGTIGVPAVFSRKYFPELMLLTGDAGAGRWLRGRRSEVTRVTLEGAGRDIDTISDMTQLDTGEHVIPTDPGPPAN
jgi:molybdenum cofactor cytidylyltransferase